MTVREQNLKINDWLIDKARTDYPDDIALIISCDMLRQPEDQGMDLFDFYVPATERGLEMARTFIVGGKGYDFYPRSWERLERMAGLDNDHVSHLALAKVIYARSDEDIAKLDALKEKLARNLADPDLTYRRALERLRAAMEIYQTMMFESSPARIRMGAGYAADYLAGAVFLVNGSFFHGTGDTRMAEMTALADYPAGFPALYEKLYHTKNTDGLLSLTHEMIALTRTFLAGRRQPAPSATGDLKDLAFWYQELVYAWRRLDDAAETGNYRRVFDQACILQQELDTVSSEFGLPAMELLDAYDADDLTAVQTRAHEMEEKILAVFRENHIELDQYADADEFIAKN